MGIVLQLIVCFAGALIGYFLYQMFTYGKENKTGKNMCATCEHCIAIDDEDYRITTKCCPLKYNEYNYPATCTCYKPRKEEIEN